MKRLLALALILSGISAYAQVQIGTAQKKKTNPYTFNLTLTPQLLLNRIDVENDGIAPKPFLQRTRAALQWEAK